MAGVVLLGEVREYASGSSRGNLVYNRICIYPRIRGEENFWMNNWVNGAIFN